MSVGNTQRKAIYYSRRDILDIELFVIRLVMRDSASDCTAFKVHVIAASAAYH